jgi:hypothetical protein
MTKIKISASLAASTTSGTAIYAEKESCKYFWQGVKLIISDEKEKV